MKKILFIEDNDAIRENVAEIVQLANYKVLTAENGKVGVELAIKEKPDLIICDIMMPVLDGYAVLHILRKNELTSQIPFIFFTAKSEKSELRRGMDLGADDYLTKPFTGTELLNAIESRLAKALKSAEKHATIANGSPEAVPPTRSGLMKFLENRSVTRFRKKQGVYLEGNRPLSLFYISQGKVKSYKRSEDGKEFIINVYSDGDFFGYASLLQNGPYQETAETMQDSELILIPKEEFEQFLKEDPAACKEVMQMLVSDVAEKDEQLVSIAYHSLRKKVADALMVISNKYNPAKLENFLIDINRENLAGIAATAKESVIRTLGEFKNEKLIDIKDGLIIILNPRKLAALLN